MPLLGFAMQSSLISDKNLPPYHKSPNGYTNDNNDNDNNSDNNKFIPYLYSAISIANQ